MSEGRSPTGPRYRYRAAIVSACSWSLHLSFCTCAAESYRLSMDWAPSAAFEHDASDMEQSCSCSSPDMRPPHETPGKIAAVKHWIGACLVAQSSSERHWTASHRTLILHLGRLSQPAASRNCIWPVGASNERHSGSPPRGPRPGT